MDAVWILDNQNVENTFHYHVTGTINFAKLNAMSTTYFSWVSAHLSDWPTNAQVLKTYLRDLTSQTGAVGEFTPLTPLVGTKVGTALPNNVTFSIKRDSQLAGRANRGRLFQIGITDTDRSDDNHIASSRANAWRDHLNTLLNSMISDNAAQEVILHRLLGTYTVIQGYTYSDLTIDAMRRRLPDHNRHR